MMLTTCQPAYMTQTRLVRPRTCFDDDGAGGQVQLRRNEGNVRKVEDLRAVRQDERPKLWCRVQDVHEATAVGRVDAGPERLAYQLAVREPAVAALEDCAGLDTDCRHGLGRLVEAALTTRRKGGAVSAGLTAVPRQRRTVSLPGK